MVLVRTYQRVTGVRVFGANAGRASRWAYVLGGLYAVAMVASLVIHVGTGLTWPTVAVAVVVAAGTVVLGHTFDAAFRAGLRGTP